MYSVYSRNFWELYLRPSDLYIYTIRPEKWWLQPSARTTFKPKWGEKSSEPSLKGITAAVVNKPVRPALEGEISLEAYPKYKQT